MPSFDVQAAKRAGMSDAQIQQFMQAKGLSPKKTLGGFAGNVVKSAGNAVTGTIGGLLNIANPDMEKNTIYNVGRTGLGAAQLLLPGEQGQEKYARQVGDFYSQRYGIGKAMRGDFKGAAQQFGDTLYNDPVGVALDASSVLGGVGAAVKGVGALSKSANLANAGSKITRAGAMIDPITVPGRLIGKGAQVAGQRLNLGKKISDFGDNYAIKSTRIADKAQSKLNRKLGGLDTRFGKNVESLVENTGLYGQNMQALDNYIAPLQESFNTSVGQSGIKISNKQILDNFGKKIAELSTPEAQANPALRTLREQLISEAQLIAAQGRKGQKSLSSLNETRKMLDETTPNAQFESGKQAYQKSLADVYRNTVNTTAGTGELGKELSALYSYKDALSKAPKGKNTLPFGLTQGAGAIVGNLMSAVPGAGFVGRGLATIGGAVAANAINSPRFIGGVAKTAKSISKLKVPKSVSKAEDIIKTAGGIGYNSAKAGRMVNQAFPTSSQQSSTSQVQKIAIPKTQTSQPPKATTPIIQQPRQSFAAPSKQPKMPTLKATVAAFGKVPKLKRSSAY